MYFPIRADRLTLPILVLVAVVDPRPPRLPYTGVGGEEDRTSVRVHILPPWDDLTDDDIRLGGGGEDSENSSEDSENSENSERGQVRPVRH